MSITACPRLKRTAQGHPGGCLTPMKVLLENMLRNEDDRTVTKADIQAFAKWAQEDAAT